MKLKKTIALGSLLVAATNAFGAEASEVVEVGKGTEKSPTRITTQAEFDLARPWDYITITSKAETKPDVTAQKWCFFGLEPENKKYFPFALNQCGIMRSPFIIIKEEDVKKLEHHDGDTVLYIPPIHGQPETFVKKHQCEITDSTITIGRKPSRFKLDSLPILPWHIKTAPTLDKILAEHKAQQERFTQQEVQRSTIPRPQPAGQPAKKRRKVTFPPSPQRNIICPISPNRNTDEERAASQEKRRAQIKANYDEVEREELARAGSSAVPSAAEVVASLQERLTQPTDADYSICDLYNI